MSDELTIKKTAKNVTDEIEVILDHDKYDGEPVVCIEIYYQGERIGYVRNRDIGIYLGYEIKKMDFDLYFQIWKK